MHIRLPRNAACWIWLTALTLTPIVTTIVQALEQYDTLRTGWSWDLAYYNQWFWAFTHGIGEISVRPISGFATEGPSVWKTNYLAPIRFLLLPAYALAPEPRTLLIIHALIFWMVVPASFWLVRSESKSSWIALGGAFLTSITPLLWPLAWNDFRELQLGIPLVLLAVQGIRSRSPRVATLGCLGMLSCRQEFAIVIATFAFLPPREQESLSQTLRWRQACLAAGLGWLLFPYFGHLKYHVGPGAPGQFIDQFFGPKAPLDQSLATTLDFLAYGLGCWAIFACWSPRVAILAIPWIWSLCSGRWALRYLETEEWHHVRYAAPAVATALAAGLVGYGRVMQRLSRSRNGKSLMAALFVGATICSTIGLMELSGRMGRIPHPISRPEAAVIRGWMGRVEPDDGVLAAYELTAPLSSRKALYSYVMDANKPRNFPTINPEVRWLFLETNRFDLQIFVRQGFQIVHQGGFASILHRPDESHVHGTRPEGE